MNNKIIILALSCFSLISNNIYAEEVRGGIKYGLEKNDKTFSIDGEFLFKKKFLYALPHIGFNANLANKVSYLYTGLTWHADFPKNVFMEASFGGAIHNGHLQRTPNRTALGSRLLFRESFALGVKVSDNSSVMVIIDHLSNADLALPNQGITALGIRFGYKF